MIIVQGTRRSGRTTALLRAHLNATNSWLLVHTEQEASRLRKALADMVPDTADEYWEGVYEDKARTIITYANTRQLRGLRQEPKVFLDNIEFFFLYTIGYPVEAFTMQEHDEH